MAKPGYKWAFPGDWLTEKINGLEAGTQFAELREIAITLAGALDSDEIQELFQSDMDNDGYFQKDWTPVVNALSRERCVELLTNIDIECRDEETVGVLREAVASAIEDGDIKGEDLES